MHPNSLVELHKYAKILKHGIDRNEFSLKKERGDVINKVGTVVP